VVSNKWKAYSENRLTAVTVDEWFINKAGTCSPRLSWKGATEAVCCSCN